MIECLEELDIDLKKKRIKAIYVLWEIRKNN